MNLFSQLAYRVERRHTDGSSRGEASARICRGEEKGGPRESMSETLKKGYGYDSDYHFCLYLGMFTSYCDANESV